MPFRPRVVPRLPGVRRLLGLPRRSRRAIAEDVDEELAFHLDMRAAELMSRRGLDADAARVEALRQFGDLDDARRYIRAVDARNDNVTRRRDHMDEFRQDLRYAWRGLRRAPGFALAVVAALALGIGATTSIATLINALLLRSLPVAEPERLVGFGDPAAVGHESKGPMRTDFFSYPLYSDLRARARTVSGLVAVSRTGRVDATVSEVPGGSLASGDEIATSATEGSEQLVGSFVSGNYFTVLGIRAAAGRTLTEADDRQAGAGTAVVISHAYWRRRFALDPSAIGRTLTLNRAATTIVGVAPAGFVGETVGTATDFWIPITMHPLVLGDDGRLRDHEYSWLMMMGRLAPGATIEQAGAEFTGLARQALVEAAGGSPDPELLQKTVAAYSGANGFSRVREQLRGPLATLLASAVLVLLIVCANVANLLLGRAASRRTEMGVRLAVGAGRARLVRQLLTESLVLGLAAAALGILLARGGVELLLRVAPSGVSQGALQTPIDLKVLAFSLGLALLSAVLAGLAPATSATRVDLATTLRAHGRGTGGSALGGGRRFGLGGVLVVAQVALSLVLLVGAGVMVRSVRNLQASPLGLARDELLMVGIETRTAGYTGPRFHEVARGVAEAIERVPGVRGATHSGNGIFSGGEGWTNVRIDGFVARADDDSLVNIDQVGPGYFETIGARMLRGRGIEERDRAGAARVTVINETMARFYFADRDPIGRYIHSDSTAHEIVGVVGDVTDHSLRAAPARRMYTAIAQGEGVNYSYLFVAVRAAGDPALVTQAVRRAVLAVDPALRIFDARPLSVIMRQSIARERFVAYLASVAGSVALLLATVGLYGVVSYAMVRRRGEFGLRMALGARPSDVRRMVLRESVTLFALGAAVGVPACVAALRLVRHQLVGVEPMDPPTLAAALVVLAASSLLAGYRPAARAARVPPLTAMREG